MKRLILSVLFLLSGATSAGAELLIPEAALEVGDRAPIFSLVAADGTLINYDKDFYGRHHLVITFFPAAFTPV